MLLELYTAAKLPPNKKRTVSVKRWIAEVDFQYFNVGEVGMISWIRSQPSDLPNAPVP